MKAKERPICRATIIRSGWRPEPEPESWSGETALAPDGQKIRLTPGFRKQMGKMIEEGYWGKAIALRTIQGKLNESEAERERRLQHFCDSMIILDETRPISVNSGDRFLSIKHAWPQQFEWSWEAGHHVPLKTAPFVRMPCWIFEEENPVSATARMVFAFLCHRGLFSTNETKTTQLSVGVSKKDIGAALQISEGVAGRALLELESLGVVIIEQLGLKYKKRKSYCNFYNANVIRAVEDPGRWAVIKASQTELIGEK